MHGNVPVMIQPKLTINTPGDIHEQEADRVAEQVVRAPQPTPVGTAQEPVVQGSAAQQAESAPVPPIVDDVLRSPGQALDAGTRAFMEPRFGHDFSRIPVHSSAPIGTQTKAPPEFASKLAGIKGGGELLDRTTRGEMERKMGADLSGVRVHSGSDAHDLSQRIGAKAFTHGENIYFKSGNYEPHSQQGKQLLAHELVHTRQRLDQLQRKIDPQARASKHNEASDPINYNEGARGHEPSKDYYSGAITAKGETNLKQADHSKPVLDSSKKHEIYFKEGDSVVNVGQNLASEASEQNMWIEVKGTGHYKEKNTETAVPNAQGWIPRRSTNMTLGLFKGLNIEDKSKSGAGKITYGEGQRIGTVSAVVLHQTDTDSAQVTLGNYQAKAENKKDPKNMHVGAQYLIGEDGQLYLVVPLNEKVDHVVGQGDQDRPVVVKEPKVADATKVTKEEMQGTRNEIEAFYDKLSAANFISKDLRDYWLALADKNSQEFYNTLKANAWRVNLRPTNRTSIGIEVVQKHKSLYKLTPFPSTYAKEQMNKIKARIEELVAAGKITEQKKDEVLKTKDRTSIQNSTDKVKYPDDTAKLSAIESLDQDVYAELKQGGWKIGEHKIFQERVGPEYDDPEFLKKVEDLDLSPELRAQLLKTVERKKLAEELALETTTVKRKKEIQDRLRALNRELFNFLSASGFNVYVDISPAQKQSMWLLVNKLVQSYGLDPSRQVVGHEDVNKKTFGEGQSQAEFIRRMTEFITNVKLLGELIAKAPSKETKEKLRKNWGSYLDIVGKLEKGTTDEDVDVKEFFKKFYKKVDEFNKSGALQLIKLYKYAQQIGSKGPG